MISTQDCPSRQTELEGACSRSAASRSGAHQPGRHVRSLLPAFLVVVVLASDATLTFAGPNAGGVLLLHADTEIVASTGMDHCPQFALSDCESAVTEVSGSEPVVFFVLAAFPFEASPRLSGVTFGLQYDPEKLVILDHGSCGGFSLPDPNWPGSGSGTATTWSEPQTQSITAIHWFVGYANDSTSLSLVPHPHQGADFADDSIPSELDAVAALGQLGFGQPGFIVCPETGTPDGIGDSEGESDEDLLAWQLDVSNRRATVVRSRFVDPAYPFDFPQDVIVLRHTSVDMSRIGEDHVSVNITSTRVPIVFDNEGLVEGAGTVELPEDGIPSPRLANTTGGSPTRLAFALSQTENPKNFTNDKTFKADLVHVRHVPFDPQLLVEWEESPVGVAIFHTDESTLFLPASGAAPLATYPRRTTDVAFSRNGQVTAAIARDDSNLSGLVIFGSRGQVIHEDSLEIGDLSQLYVTPTGTFAMATRQTRTGTSVAVWNLVTYEQTILDDLPRGYRYHSADGNTFLIVTPGQGAASLFDCHDPLVPLLLGTYTADSIIYTGAVSGDGSYIALQIVNNEDPALKDVLVLDRTMRVATTPIAQTNCEGLQFVGPHLFVGIQDNSLPATIAFSETSAVYLFRLSF